jgi:hypothetical protein
MQTTLEFTNNCTEVTADYGAVGHYRQQRVVFEICALLGYYAAYNGNSFPTFSYYLSGCVFKVKEIQKENLLGFFLPLNKRPLGSTKTSARKYYYTLRNIQEERSSHIIRRGTKKSRKSRT